VVRNYICCTIWS